MSIKLKAITGVIVLAAMLMAIESTYYNYCYPKRCPKPYYFDWTTCRCKQCEITKCPSGQQLNSRRCRCEYVYRQCICTRQCKPPYALHSRKCECVCNRVCSEGHKLNENCECVPLTCSTAITRQECLSATCAGYSRKCVYTQSNKCVCPCCVSDNDPKYQDYCNSLSPSGREQCNSDTLCTYICTYG